MTRPAKSAARRVNSRKPAILSLLLMALGVLVFLALASYDPADEANADIKITDLYKVFTSDPVAKAKADTAQNWLGLTGAVISDVLIKSTIGYAIFILPVLLAYTSLSILRKGDKRNLLNFSLFSVTMAFLFSLGMGLARLTFPEGGIGMQMSGVVGDFSALVVSQLIGLAGGWILVATCVLATLVLGMNLDLQQIADSLRSGYLRFADWLGSKMDDWRERRLQKKFEREKEALTPVPSVKVKKSVAEEHVQSEPKKIEPVVKRSLSLDATHGGTGPIDPQKAKPIRFEIEQTLHEDEVNFDEREDKGKDEFVPELLDYVYPSVELLDPPRPSKEDVDDEELQANAALLRDTLAEFDVELESVSVTPGPVVTLYELVPASGVKISKIVSLENDIALKLAAKGIRIMAPIPGKAAVGVEIPNHNPSLVTIRSVINSAKFRDTTANLPLAMGKIISGEVFTDDLSKMPHLLIAGSTGSGKSVGINTILASLLFRLHPSDLKLVIIDPKKIELNQYARLRNHFLAISPDVNEEIITTPRNAVLALKGVEYEMEKRYDKLAAAAVRNIADYNERIKSGKLKDTETIKHTKLPYLIVVIDELADLMITAAKEVEEPIARLAQLARAVGIHLILATQRPSVDVITGVIKANFPARIAYQVASKTDSRTILDMNGAEQLLGNGDMLYLASGSPKPIRLQNAFITTDEVEAVMDHVSGQKGYSKPFMLPSLVEKKKNSENSASDDRDDLFEEAAYLIVRHQQGSVSLLQRRLKVGYSRAARIVDELEAAGIVGPFDGSKAREVLVGSEEELNMILGD